MTVENISWSISTKECCRPRRGLNPRPPGLQSDGASNWATEAGFLLFIDRLTNISINCASPKYNIFYRSVMNDRLIYHWTNYDRKQTWQSYNIYKSNYIEQRLMHPLLKYTQGHLVLSCVEVIRPSQPNWVMSREVSLPNRTFFRQKLTTVLLESAEGREYYKKRYAYLEVRGHKGIINNHKTVRMGLLTHNLHHSFDVNQLHCGIGRCLNPHHLQIGTV